MRRALASVAAMWACSVVAAPTAVVAQAVGAIAGIVADESGAVIPGVGIEVTNSATGLVRTPTTGADGYYTVIQSDARRFQDGPA